jgi:Signal transduction histidine kinase regulating C4-dicarboxylate transport system
VTEYRFEIDPRVIFDLGESLISDEVTALVELVKNAYDADATKVTIAIETEAEPPPASRFGESRGYISVSDDGTGMDADDIRRGWLVVARSPKRAMKTDGVLTPLFGRVPLGDKGLGRLGAQRLGEHLELFTSKTVVEAAVDSSGVETKVLRPTEGRAYIGINWREFASCETLSEVPVRHELTEKYERGTRLIITGLRDPEVWKPDALPALQARLGQLISPFQEVASFRVSGRFNGQPFDLVDVSERLLDMATQRVTFAFVDGRLEVAVDYRPTVLRGPRSEEWSRLIAPDQGAAFREWLHANPGKVHAVEQGQDGWFLRVSQVQDADRLGELALQPELESTTDGSEPAARDWADPGPFHGEIHAFDLGAESKREAQLSDYSRIVRSLAGIRVYRDGFAIRPYGIDHDDWLQLGSQWSSGASYYGLKPTNALGFVAITAGANQQLREKTDREGFTESPASRNFVALVRRVVQFSNDANDKVRRAYLDFVQESQRHEVGLRPIRDPGEALAEVRRAAVESRSIEASAGSLTAAIAASRKAVAASRSVEGSDADEQRELLEQLTARAEELVATIERHVERVGRMNTLADVLERDLDRLGEQVGDFAELAALGLTVESIAHELRNVVNSLAQRTRELSGRISSMPGADVELLAYFEYVRSAMSAIRKQLSHLSPALRYVREERDTFELRAFVDEFAHFHQERLARASIRLVVDEPFASVLVRMNKGRLTQVLDNLVQNSEYWLTQDVKARRISEAEIHVQGLSGGRLRVWDTGRGFDPAIEDAAFEPFVTNKPTGAGRGLGLFIVRQLLRAAGAAIELLPDRNSVGGRYILEIDLGGAVVAGDS